MRTIILLTISNLFMNLAWYGHLLFRSPVRWNYFASYALIVGAIFFAFKY